MFHIHHSNNSGSILENLSGIVNSTSAMYFPLINQFLACSLIRSRLVKSSLISTFARWHVNTLTR